MSAIILYGNVDEGAGSATILYDIGSVYEGAGPATLVCNVHVNICSTRYK